MTDCLINGAPNSLISVRHRALAYGDGVFETCFVEPGNWLYKADHLARLRQGAGQLQLRWDQHQEQQLLDEIDALLATNCAPAVLKIILARQYPGRGYDFDPSRQLTDRIVMRYPFQPPAWIRTGAIVSLARIFASQNPSLAGVKHLNRLDSVLARQEARRSGAHEALMCLPDNTLLEGSMSNLYVRIDGQWQTPELSQGGVKGIIRQQLLSHTGLQFEEARLNIASLAQVDLALISNTLIGLVPVIELVGRRLMPLPDADLNLFKQCIGLSCD